MPTTQPAPQPAAKKPASLKLPDNTILRSGSQASEPNLTHLPCVHSNSGQQKLFPWLESGLHAPSIPMQEIVLVHSRLAVVDLLFVLHSLPLQQSASLLQLLAHQHLFVLSLSSWHFIAPQHGSANMPLEHCFPLLMQPLHLSPPHWHPSFSLQCSASFSLH